MNLQEAEEKSIEIHNAITNGGTINIVEVLMVVKKIKPLIEAIRLGQDAIQEIDCSCKECFVCDFKELVEELDEK